MQIYLYFIGKPKNAAANTMAAEYVKMAARYMPCQQREINPDRFDPWKQHPSARKVLLDPLGKQLDSPAPRLLEGELEAALTPQDVLEAVYFGIR